MSNSVSLFRCLVLWVAFLPCAFCQDAAAPAAKVPLDHVIGTITAVDKAAKTVTVQEDKTNTVHLIDLANTKTLLKVEPTAKDLKSAVRITADDLETGDRVDIRGTKVDETPTTLNAKSVILMSGRALAATHEQQSAAWAKATSGRVTAVDPAAGKITADVRVGGALQPINVQTAATTEFTRYSPESGKADPSQIAQIQVGDQIKVIGDKNSDGSTITAQRVYSGAFRTVSVTVSSVGADGKTITAKDLATKKELTIALNTDATIHKLPPMMAAYLARRLNPGAAATAAGGTPGGGPPSGGSGGGMANGAAAHPSGTPGGPPGAGGQGNWSPGAGGGGSAGGMGGGGARGSGDISQMIDRTPTIPITDLKPGDALVISGVASGGDNSHLLANTIIAGVEPILQSAPTQRGGGRSVGGDWGLGEMSAPQ
jgi:Cu/Ag efflux protein CusF